MRKIAFVLIFQCLLSTCTAGDLTGPLRSIGFSDLSSELLSPGSHGDYGALWVDLDGDDLLDLVFINHVTPMNFFRQLPNHSFSDLTAQTGINPIGRDRHGASCGDYDNDGDMDLYISNGAEKGAASGDKSDELLRNDGGFQFSDVTLQAGATNDQGRGRSGIWIDYDNDGLLDLYLANFKSGNVMYRNNGNGTFSDVTDETHLGLSQTRAAWADYDQDGDVDVAVSWPLRIFRNNGKDGFEDVTGEMGIRKLGGYALAWGDVDGDGDSDLLVVEHRHPGILLINDGGKLSPFISENNWSFKADTTGSGVTWGDLDNDGDLDLVAVRSDGLRVFENQGELRFTEIAVQLSQTPENDLQGDPALGDFNNDGYLDIAIESMSGNRLLKNNGSGNNWLKLKFEGHTSNRMGYGAKVWIYHQSVLVGFREHLGDNGALFSMGCGPLHFGLANLKEVDITVQWPSGKINRLIKVASNQLLLVREPETD